MTVRFSPSSAGGKTADLRVVSNGASSPDTVALSGTGIAVPQPPTGVAAVAGDGQVTVSWSAPTDDGGSPVLYYTATGNPGGHLHHHQHLVCGFRAYQRHRLHIHGDRPQRHRHVHPVGAVRDRHARRAHRCGRAQ